MYHTLTYRSSFDIANQKPNQTTNTTKTPNDEE
jgi:hypothetical protein